MCGRVATSRSSASCAPLPAAIRSSAIGPSAGSVTFWLATAPTPGRAWAHRAATAGDEEDTAMPNDPVAAQRAAMEKVTPPPRG